MLTINYIIYFKIYRYSQSDEQIHRSRYRRALQGSLTLEEVGFAMLPAQVGFFTKQQDNKHRLCNYLFQNIYLKV